PSVAPESHGDMFDGTENDELLTLSILALSDDEKREMAAMNPRTRSLLERVQQLRNDDVRRLHGTFRDRINVGDRVRLAPKRSPRRGADVMDVALAGRTAVVE